MTAHLSSYTTCLLYDTEAAVNSLEGLSLARCDPNYELDHKDMSHHVDELAMINEFAEVDHKVSEKMTCVTCGVDFVDRIDQREHYRSDWHRHNLKRRLKSLPPVTDEEFDAMLDDVSSISGSDSDNDLEPHSRHGNSPSRDSSSNGDLRSVNMVVRRPKIYLRNSQGRIISVYKTLLYNKKTPLEHNSHILSAVQSLPRLMKWAVFLSGGGHFASAIFDKGTIVCHKTFHRYVVRAKSGSVQSSRDGRGSAPRSAGATLRRYNEAVLAQEVQELIASWSNDLRTCDLVFIRSPNYSVFKHYITSVKDAEFNKTDSRFRNIPFVTRRPTMNEVKRVHLTLASIEIYGTETDLDSILPRSPPRKFNSSSNDLEVIEVKNREQSGGKKKAGGQGKVKESRSKVSEVELKVHGNVDRAVDEGSDEEASSIQVLYEMVEQEVTFGDLKQFESYTPRPKRTRKKKAKVTPQRVHDPVDAAKKDLKNSLFTACKTGDLKTLRNILSSKKSSNKQNLHLGCSITSASTRPDESVNDIRPPLIECIQELSKATAALLGTVNKCLDSAPRPVASDEDGSVADGAHGADSETCGVVHEGCDGTNSSRDVTEGVIMLDRDEAGGTGDGAEGIAKGDGEQIGGRKDGADCIMSAVDETAGVGHTTGGVGHTTGGVGDKTTHLKLSHGYENRCEVKYLPDSVEMRLIDQHVEMNTGNGRNCELPVSNDSLGTEADKMQSADSRVGTIEAGERHSNPAVETESSDNEDRMGLEYVTGTDVRIIGQTVNDVLDVNVGSEGVMNGGLKMCFKANGTIEIMKELSSGDVDSLVSQRHGLVNEVTDNLVETGRESISGTETGGNKMQTSERKHRCSSQQECTACLKNNLDSKTDVIDSSTIESEHGLSEVRQLSGSFVKLCINEPIGLERMTVLHVAAKHNHACLISELLTAGADPAIRDGRGTLPYHCSSSKATRNEFRLFRAQNPDLFNYADAQIPAAVTGDDLKKKQENLAQKRSRQKHKKQERNMFKQIEEKQLKKEGEEKKIFLALSDREKRAVAAEMRLLLQSEKMNVPLPALIRCFQCAGDMTGKVPFEYSSNKFCSPVCLRQHRLGNK